MELGGRLKAVLDDTFYVFELHLSDVQVLAAETVQDWRAAVTSTTSPMHVLERLSVDCTLHQRKTSAETAMAVDPMTILKGSLPKVELQLTEQKIIQLTTCLAALSSFTDQRAAEPSTVARSSVMPVNPRQANSKHGPRAQLEASFEVLSPDTPPSRIVPGALLIPSLHFLLRV